MQERFYESGSCVQKNCASLGVHPSCFSPSSVQFKGEINGALPRKRHQKRHLEFCTAYLLSRGSGVRVSPGAPLTPTLFAHGIGAVRGRAIVGVGENSVHVEILQEEDSGACPYFEALRHPDRVSYTSLLQNDVRATLHAGHE